MLIREMNAQECRDLLARLSMGRACMRQRQSTVTLSRFTSPMSRIVCAAFLRSGKSLNGSATTRSSALRLTKF